MSHAGYAQLPILVLPVFKKGKVLFFPFNTCSTLALWLALSSTELSFIGLASLPDFIALFCRGQFHIQCMPGQLTLCHPTTQGVVFLLLWSPSTEPCSKTFRRGPEGQIFIAAVLSVLFPRVSGKALLPAEKRQEGGRWTHHMGE